MRGICIRLGWMVTVLALISATGFAQYRVISTYAGPRLPTDGALAAAEAIDSPGSVTPDGAGGFFVASQSQNRVYRVAADGKLSLVAGSGAAGYGGDGGPAASAQLYGPCGVALSSAGNLYIADTNNHRIRQVTPAGVIRTVAGSGTAGYSGDGGPATSAQLSSPLGIAVDDGGNLYIADTGNHRVRQVTPAGLINTTAGTGTAGYSGDGGPAASAQLNAPSGVALDVVGNLYVADTNNHRIRHVAPAGVINTVAGTGTAGYSGDGGPATSAQLRSPHGVALDGAGILHLADTNNHRIRLVTPAGVINTVAGTGTAGYSGDGGPATSAQLNEPFGIALDPAGNLHVADTSNHRIRRVTPAGAISTAAGNGTAGYSGDGGPVNSAQMRYPYGVALDAVGNLYIADTNNHRVRRVTPAGLISTVAGTGTIGYSGDGGPAASAQLTSPCGVAADGAGNLYIADTGNYCIRRVTPAGVISTMAGNGTYGYSGDGGPATGAQLYLPYGVAADSAGDVYIADTGSHRIRRVDAAGIISTVAGNGTGGYSGDGGAATAAQLQLPHGVAIDTAGNLYIADSLNNRIRQVTAAGVISTVAGTGAYGFGGDGGPAVSAQLRGPNGVAVDAAGILYIADSYNNRIRQVTSAGIISTVAGTGTEGYSGDGGAATAAQLYYPFGVALGSAQHLYIAESRNHRIRKTRILRPAWDADADIKTDITVWQPSSGSWYVLPSASPGTFTGTQWGISTDLPVAGDYDGDGKSDMAVWRPESGVWYTLPSGSPGTFTEIRWGISGDMPVPADYDGDGKTDIAVWRRSNGVWYILPSGSPGTFTDTQWGVYGDIPVAADYDGDGRTDIALWRPSSGIWYVLPSGSPGTFAATQWGISGDIPVPGNYDGDGKTDLAVWRPGSGAWFVMSSASPGTFTSAQWGAWGDVPMPGFYDGDGRSDIAVWRPGLGVWYVLPSSSPGTFTAAQWGIPTDLPIPRPPGN